VRLIAATNQDLAASLAAKRFRSDLYYRLKVFPIALPPLRDRPDDIPLLVEHYVRKFAARMDKKIDTIPRSTMSALSRWHWPGNVRELENLMERSVILTESNVLRVPLSELKGEAAASPTLGDLERAQIERALQDARGTISGPQGAAARLGVKRSTLQSKLRRFGIRREQYSR
jgi:formate hydrogenlyase transcriptional activator